MVRGPCGCLIDTGVDTARRTVRRQLVRVGTHQACVVVMLSQEVGREASASVAHDDCTWPREKVELTAGDERTKGGFLHAAESIRWGVLTCRCIRDSAVANCVAVTVPLTVELKDWTVQRYGHGSRPSASR
ncbi:hypothetical protein BD626DRAFT_263437 [Schizophyllum amplum]|uniref:Uncharacterized protein n=1 Tax=Schizophyllum amplum TaxID=97359 RepID=A0A550CGN5_9AGAR|nr:hypothetical protein BD626DRAFT_263437 [Auriculariopsis ampla]